jgi:hypothetical protein
MSWQKSFVEEKTRKVNALTQMRANQLTRGDAFSGDARGQSIPARRSRSWRRMTPEPPLTKATEEIGDVGKHSKIGEDIQSLTKSVQELTKRACERVQRAAELPPRLLDVDDAGRYLGMGDKAVRELIVNGELPYIQKIAARSPYLIDIRDLDRWIDQNKIRAGR